MNLRIVLEENEISFLCENEKKIAKHDLNWIENKIYTNFMCKYFYYKNTW